MPRPLSESLNDLGQQDLQGLSSEQLQRLANAMKNGKMGKGKGAGKMAGALGKLADARRMLAGLSKPMPGMMMGMRGMSCMCTGNRPGNGGKNGGKGWNGELGANKAPGQYTRKGDILNPKAGDGPEKPDEQSCSIDIKGEPGQVGETRVPYYELDHGVLNHAEHAIDTENVPSAERQRVKQYFNALDPNAQ